MAKRPGGEFFKIVNGKPTDIDLHMAILGDDDQHTWNPNDPRQLAEHVAAVKAREAAERRKREAPKGRR